MRLFNLGINPHSKGLSFSESTGALAAKRKIKKDKRVATNSLMLTIKANTIIEHRIKLKQGIQ